MSDYMEAFTKSYNLLTTETEVSTNFDMGYNASMYLYYNHFYASSITQITNVVIYVNRENRISISKDIITIQGINNDTHHALSSVPEDIESYYFQQSTINDFPFTVEEYKVLIQLSALLIESTAQI